MTRSCVACRTRLDPVVPDVRHPLCRLDPPPATAEIRTALVVLGDVLGIEGVSAQTDQPADRKDPL